MKPVLAITILAVSSLASAQKPASALDDEDPPKKRPAVHHVAQTDEQRDIQALRAEVQRLRAEAAACRDKAAAHLAAK